MRNAHPLVSDLLIASYARAKILLDQLVVVLVDGSRGQRNAFFAHSVHIAFELRKHGLTVKGSLVGLHQLVENVELFVIALAFCKHSVRHKELVNGRSYLCHKNGVVRVVGLVVVGGEPSVHRVSCLVCEGGNVIELVGIVEQNVRLCSGSSRRERAASLAAARIYVNPSLFAKTCAQVGFVFFAKYFNGLENFFNCLFVGVFAIDVPHQRCVNIVQVQALQTENLFFEIVIIVQNRETFTHCADEVVVDNGSYFITKGGSGNGAFKIANFCSGGCFLYSALVHSCKGVCKLLVGLIYAIECSLAHSAILTHQVHNVVTIGDFNLFALRVADLAKTKVRVCKDAANAGVRTERVLHARHQHLTLVRKSVLLFEHDLIDHTAESLKLGTLNKPSVNNLSVELENIRGDKPSCLSCRNGKASCSCAQRLRVVIGSIYRKAQGCILPQLVNKFFGLCHIGKRRIELFCALGDGLFVCAESLDLLFCQRVIGIECRLIGIDCREVPFIFGVNIFSFKYHNHSSKRVFCDFFLIIPHQSKKINRSGIFSSFYLYIKSPRLTFSLARGIIPISLQNERRLWL